MTITHLPWLNDGVGTDALHAPFDLLKFLSFIRNILKGVPVVAQWLPNPTRNQEVVGLIPVLAQ